MMAYPKPDWIDASADKLANISGSLRMQVVLALVCTLAAGFALVGCGAASPPIDTAHLAEPAKHLMVPPGDPPDIPTNPDCEIQKKCRGKYYIASRQDRAALAGQVRGLQSYVNLIRRRKVASGS